MCIELIITACSVFKVLALNRFCSSHLNLILVIKNLKGLAIFNFFRALLQLQLQEGVGDYADTDVNGLDVILYVGN